jgi:hypothetical protein
MFIIIIKYLRGEEGGCVQRERQTYIYSEGISLRYNPVTLTMINRNHWLGHMNAVRTICLEGMPLLIEIKILLRHMCEYFRCHFNEKCFISTLCIRYLYRRRQWLRNVCCVRSLTCLWYSLRQEWPSWHQKLSVHLWNTEQWPSLVARRRICLATELN